MDAERSQDAINRPPSLDDDRAAILDFWRAVELLSPPNVPRAKPKDNVVDIRPGQPLPWEPAHQLAQRRPRPRWTWRHEVYCGIHALDDAYDTLRELLPPTRDGFDRRPLGQSALAAFSVTSEGTALLGSEVLSSCAWAVGRLARKGRWSAELLDDFATAQADFSERLRELLAEDDDAPDAPAEEDDRASRPIDLDLLLRCTDEIAAMLGTDGAFAATGIRISSVAVPERRALDTDGSDFLNSFVADDLRDVTAAVRRGASSRALRAYLATDTELELAGRFDLDKRLDVVRRAVAPGHVPAGRWPGNVGHPLALGQQFAVNAALHTIGDGGIFAVNGPPGTGKTTMLRDMVAAIVVERADRLAELEHPRDAFRESRTWRCEGYHRKTWLWDERLTGFEMLVACATNAAAENITVEIPGLDAVDAAWAERAAYHAEVATEVLGSPSQATGSPARAWGLVAARLGNARNNTAFRQAFWGPGARGADQDPPPTLRTLLDASIGTAPDVSWEAATAAYRSAGRRVEDLRTHRADDAALLGRHADAEAAADAARQELAAAVIALDAAVAALAGQRSVVAACEARRQLELDARREHAEFRPGFVETLFTFGRAMRRWRVKDHELEERLDAASATLEAADEAAAALEQREAAAARARDEQNQKLVEAEDGLARAEAALADARQRWGEHFADEAWWADRERRAFRAPWIDEAWNEARTELFVAALKLHEAFLHCAPAEMHANLKGGIDIISRSAPRDLPSEIVRAAWQSLFFVVPVISTTFASLPRLFNGLEQEALGWLFVDEAGQAKPQDVVGALWRTRRAVVVGDPLQLEPIVNAPLSVQDALAAEYGVGPTWLPSQTSAQQLADRSARFGTYRGSDAEPLWVGAPLNVHRRCDEPMFSIVNEIAYQRQMVNGTAPRPPLPLRPSEWIDVAGGDASGHWLPAEGRALEALLDEIGAAGIPMSQVFAIAPFRDVARHLATITRKHAGLLAGTVHTAQGRESDVVVLVLGGDPARPGAKAWAAEAPNLVNVAVSRARRRLYVIGDRAAWSAHPYFKTLAARLPVAVAAT